MLYINKNQFVESGEIQTILEEDVIQVRRNITRVLNGEKETKLAPSQKVIKVVRKLLNVIVSTGINELCGPKSQFTNLLQCDGKHTNDYIKNYFKGYGIGEYSFSNKYNITISGESKSIKRETHYYMYINKETLELMRDTMNIEGVDWDALIAQIPECERKCNIIGNKTQTEINVMNYIDNEFVMNYRINIEKNLFTKEGHYSKETNIINTNDNSVVELSKKENDFTPKAVVVEEVVEEVQEAEEVVEVEESQDLHFSLSKKSDNDSFMNRMSKRNKPQLKGEEAYLKRVAARKYLDSLQQDEEPEVEEPVVEEVAVVEEVEAVEEDNKEVTMEDLNDKLEQLRALQSKSKSRMLAMEINSIENKLNSDELDMNDMFNHMQGLLDKFRKYEAMNDSNNTPAIRRRKTALGLSR